MTDLLEHRFDLAFDEEPSRILRARLTRPASGGPVPFVLLLHGFKGFMDWGFFPLLAQRLAQAGFAAVAFNASGSGVGPDLLNFTEEEAFAEDTLTRQLEDIERVRSHVASGSLEGVDATSAGLFGHSRGGGLGLVHAAEQGGYGAVVTWAAIDTVQRWDPATLSEWRRLGHLPVVNARTGQTLRMDVAALDDLERNARRLDIEAACGRLGAPALVCHGTQDEAVQFGAMDRILRALPEAVGRGLPVPGAGHTFGARHPMGNPPDELELALAETVAWFRAHLQRASD